MNTQGGGEAVTSVASMPRRRGRALLRSTGTAEPLLSSVEMVVPQGGGCRLMFPSNSGDIFFPRVCLRRVPVKAACTLGREQPADDHTPPKPMSRPLPVLKVKHPAPASAPAASWSPRSRKFQLTKTARRKRLGRGGGMTRLAPLSPVCALPEVGALTAGR